MKVSIVGHTALLAVLLLLAACSSATSQRPAHGARHPGSGDALSHGRDDADPKDGAPMWWDGVVDGASRSLQEEARKRAKAPPKKAKIVEFAPEVTVENDDDIDEDGKCKAEIKQYCDDVEEGESKLADCISDSITESESGAEGAPSISDACREEVYKYNIDRSTNINKNVPLAKACKKDATQFCNVTWFFGYKAGQIVSCLRDVEAQLSKKCKTEIFKVKLNAAKDFRADPMLYEACKDDAESQCKDVKNGNGRIQGCLRDKRMSLSWACEEQLFRQEMENADDVR